MDFDSIKAQLELSRRTTVKVEDVTFTLILPTEHAIRVAYEANRQADRILQAQALRPLLEQAVMGWEGMTVRHLLPEGEEVPLAFSPPALAAVLEHRQDLADALQLEIFALHKARQEKLRAAAKN